jgi:glycosyltransferase involved in cell wall biosynthesis
MGSGAAIVAHDTPEHREVVGDAAWIVDVHDSAALARALSELARSPELAASLRKRALERARSRYDWEPIAEGYAKLLRRLAGEAASSSEPC